MNKIFTAILIATLSIFLFSCKSQLEKEIEQIEAYINSTNDTAYKTKTNLYFIQIRKGTGIRAEKGTLVAIHYSCYLLNGKKIDSSYGGDSLVFILGYGTLISGVEEGISYMYAGGKSKLIMPSTLAYGEEGKGEIPPNSPLIFEIELLTVFKPNK